MRQRPFLQADAFKHDLPRWVDRALSVVFLGGGTAFVVLWLLGGRFRDAASIVYTMILLAVAVSLFGMLRTPGAWEYSMETGKKMFGRHARWAAPNFLQTRTVGWIMTAGMAAVVIIRTVEHIA